MVDMPQTKRRNMMRPVVVQGVDKGFGKHGSVVRLKASIFNHCSSSPLSMKDLNERPCSIPGKEIPKLAFFLNTSNTFVPKKSKHTMDTIIKVKVMIGMLDLRVFISSFFDNFTLEET